MQPATKVFALPSKAEENHKAKGGVFFTEEEWEYFLLESERMDNSSPEKKFDAQKAVNNARYLAMIDRGIKQIHEGGGRLVTDEELRKMIYE